MLGGAWWATVHGVAKRQTRLSDFTFTFHFSLSCIGEGNGNPLQCSCLENPRDGVAWWAAVYGVAQSRTWLKQLSSSSSRFQLPLGSYLRTEWLDHSLVKCLNFFFNLQAGICPTGASQVVLVVKNPPANTGDIRDADSVPGLRRSPGGEHGIPLQYSCLENLINRGAWWATAHMVTMSQTQSKQLSMHTRICPRVLVTFPESFCRIGIMYFLNVCWNSQMNSSRQGVFSVVRCFKL